MTDVTHVIIDEIHERSLDSDFLLIIIRDLLPKYVIVAAAAAVACATLILCTASGAQTCE